MLQRLSNQTENESQTYPQIELVFNKRDLSSIFYRKIQNIDLQIFA